MNEIITTTQGTEIEAALPVGYGENASLAVSLARAEVDQQIMTARALPRKISQVVQNINTLATLDEETAKECIYALPRAGKAIKGPSIRLAEIIFSQWGNARVGSRVVHVDRFEKYVESESVFHDLESNALTTARVRRRISDKGGKVLNEDMIVVTGNAACSIAKRNAILGGVPKAVWRKAYDAVERVLAGDIKTLSVRRADAMKAFAAFGVKPEQIFQALNVKGVDDITLEHMPVMIGMHSALKSGESTVEEMFPKPAAIQAGGAKGLDAALDNLAKGADPEKSTKAKKKEPEPDHDKETGEIKEEAKPEKTDEATKAEDSDKIATDDAPADEGDPESEEGDADLTLLERAQTIALQGTGAFLKWRNSLTEEEAKELKPNLEKLKAAAKAAEAVS
jgi:copper chaperone CopZ